MRLRTRITSDLISIAVAVLDSSRAMPPGPSTESPASVADRVDVFAALG